MDGRPTAKEMGLDEEFVYSVRIVDFITKVDLSKDCDRNDSIRAIERVFREYKTKVLNEYTGQSK
jgi:hypothetical protein